MHRLRRKLSEPRNAGHRTAASLCSQRMTSDADSESICSMSNMCPQTHGHIKKRIKENREKPAILKARVRFATETSLELRDFRLDLQRLEQGPYALGLVDIFRKVDQVSPKRSAGTKNLKQANIKAKPVLARFDQAL